MTTPAYAENWKYSHWESTRVYRVPGFDEPFPSVTSVIKLKNKPALIQWAANMAAEYAVKHMDALVQLDQEGAMSAIKGNWRNVRDRAASFGTEVHQFIETGMMPFEGSDARPYVDQAHNMLEAEGFAVTGQEITLINLKSRYAGTVDAIGQWDGQAAILDWKTGGLYDSAALQLAALMDCEHYLDDDGEIVQLPEAMIANGLAVQLKPDAFRVERMERVSPLGVSTMRAFEGMIPLWHYETQNGESPWERKT